MPIYEYTCKTCGVLFDRLVRAADEPACPSCESTALERRISTPARAVQSPRGAGPSLPMARGGGSCCGGSCGCR